MKRTNVVLDEDLLEEARRVTGERTYSGAITKALERVVRQNEFRRALLAFEEEAAKGSFFHPSYAEEIAPLSRSIHVKKRARISADEKRVPRKKSHKRGSR